MSTEEKTYTNIEEAKEGLKTECIDRIFRYIETKDNNCLPNHNQYFNGYNIIQIFGDLGDNESESLFQYHNEVIKDYLEKCFKLISSKPKDELIDLFIKQTENINILLYWLNRIFTYLDRFYLKARNKKLLAVNEMKLYKEIYFNPLKDDIYKELSKFIKQDRNGNKESRKKIKSIMRILNDMDISEPKVIKENNKIIWVMNEYYKKTDDDIYKKEWYEKYFKEETIQFAKEKAEKEIKEKTIFEFILSQLKYLEEEKERQEDYINVKYHDIINKVNYQYLLENVEELVKKEGIAYMFENRKKDELKKAYELFKLYEPSLNVLKEAFISFMKKKYEELKEKKEGKDGEELNNFKNDVENLVSECFENNTLFQDEKNKILLNN